MSRYRRFHQKRPIWVSLPVLIAIQNRLPCGVVHIMSWPCSRRVKCRFSARSTTPNFLIMASPADFTLAMGDILLRLMGGTGNSTSFRYAIPSVWSLCSSICWNCPGAESRLWARHGTAGPEERAVSDGFMSMVTKPYIILMCCIGRGSARIGIQCAHIVIQPD